MTRKASPVLVLSGLRAVGVAVPVVILLLLSSIVVEAITGLRDWEHHVTFLGAWSPAGLSFGIIELVVSTLFAAIPASILAVVLGTLGALRLAIFANSSEQLIAEIVVSVFAGVPSIIVGIVLLEIVAGTIGYSLIAGIIAVTCMVLPSYMLAATAVFRQLPEDAMLTARALGYSDIQVILKTIWPLSRTMIFGLVFLCLARAMGEATAVSLVTGGIITDLPPALLDPINTLATAVLKGYPNASGAYQGAVFVCAAILLVFVGFAVAVGQFLRRADSIYNRMSISDQ